MSRGKYLSLEEARKKGQIDQFGDNHPKLNFFFKLICIIVSLLCFFGITWVIVILLYDHAVNGGDVSLTEWMHHDICEEWTK